MLTRRLPSPLTEFAAGNGTWSISFQLGLTACGAGAVATSHVTNLRHFPVWPAAIPAGGGIQLSPGQSWHIPVPARTAGRIWARTGCDFLGEKEAACTTGDCTGAMRCVLPGDPPATLAQFTIGAVAGNGIRMDIYGISVVYGFNVPMDLLCGSAAGDVVLRCREPTCADASRSPDEPKMRTCTANSDYHVVFCLDGKRDD